MSLRDHHTEVLRNFLGKPENRYGRGSPPRPFIIEFTGSPSSGKTTIIKEVERFLRRSGFRVFCPQESMEAIRHIPRDGRIYDARVATYALNIVIDCSSSCNFDFVLLDRGLFDIYCWQDHWHSMGRITTEQKDVMQQFFLDEAWIGKIDFALFVVCEGNVAFAREYQVSVTDKPGGKTNPESLAKFYSVFTGSYQKLKNTFPQVDILDTSNLTKQEMVGAAVDKIIGFLGKKTSCSENFD